MKGKKRISHKHTQMYVILGAAFAMIAVPLIGLLSSLPGLADAAETGNIVQANHRQTDRMAFWGNTTGQKIYVPGNFSLSEKLTENLILSQYAGLFGITDPGKELVKKKTNFAENNRKSIRYQQQYNGLPVFAGELVVNTRNTGELLSISGEVSPDINISTHARITPDIAENSALSMVAAEYGINKDNLEAAQPELWIYDSRLIMPGDGWAELVWLVEVNSNINDSEPINELVLVNASTSIISLHFNQVHTAKRYETYDVENTNSSPWQGTLLCTEAEPNCTNGVDPEADAVHDYTSDTYDFYLSYHGRDSIDGNGKTLQSSVHYGTGVCNAYGGTGGFSYGDGCGIAFADDVVGHEVTHGVTGYTSDLIYYLQSGAINESFSDIWGEFVDLTNGKGDDSPEARWKMGEDIVGASEFRDMSDPTPYGDPDKMTSPNYYLGTGDNGGVHYNSGIGNKAAYLMTDGTSGEPGGVFNGYSINGIGITKVAAVFYEVQTNYLTKAANYNDLYYALLQACSNLVGGSEGITTADCQEVQRASRATEMHLLPVSTSKISGTLYEADGVTPITSDSLMLRAVTGDPCIGSVRGGNAVSNVSNGTYSFIDLPAGTYYIYADNPEKNYLDEWWNGASPDSSDMDCSLAQSITVTQGQEATDINFVIEKGAQISGIVYEEDGVTPLMSQYQNSVTAFTGDPCSYPSYVSNGIINSSDGTYTIFGLPAGTYYLQSSNYQVNFLREWWTGGDPDPSDPDCALAQGITVELEQTVDNTDFILKTGAKITGTVYQNDNTTPITDNYININVHSGDPCGAYSYDGNGFSNITEGTYEIMGLASGAYYLRASSNPIGGASYYLDEWWNGASPDPSDPACNLAQTITVVEGNTYASTDFSLDSKGSITGTIFKSDGTTPITGEKIHVEIYRDMCSYALPEQKIQVDDSDGTYTIKGLEEVAYYVRASTDYQVNYLSEWWTNGSPDPSSIDCNAAQGVLVGTNEISTVNFALDLGGVISGTVYQSDGSTPIESANVTLFLGDPCNYTQPAGGTTADASGFYSIEKLLPGTYYARSYLYNENYLAEWWTGGNPDSSDPDCSLAQSITISPEQNISNTNFTLGEGAIISGTIYHSDNITPILNDYINIQLFDTPACSSMYPFSTTQIDTASGTYLLQGLRGRTYYLRTSTYPSKYVDEWWTGGAPDPSNADCNLAQPITAVEGVSAQNINFALDRGTDFGDAPDPSYPTLLINDGARHIIDNTLLLGYSADHEFDGQPTTNADGDYDNGINFSSLIAQGNQADIAVTASMSAGSSAYLNAWIDYNSDGDWADAGEQIFVDQLMINGLNNLAVNIPLNAVLGNTYARFRISTEQSISFTGLASDGEVEDYMITIVPDEPPAIEITQPDGVADLAENAYIIRWTDEDLESDAAITLFYDTNSSGQDGVQITDCDPISEDNNFDYCYWDTSAIPERGYYIYAVIDDGVNTPVVDYSDAPLVVNRQGMCPISLCNGDFESPVPLEYWKTGNGTNQITTAITQDGANAVYTEHTYDTSVNARWSGVSQTMIVGSAQTYGLTGFYQSENAARGHIKVTWKDISGTTIKTDYPITNINGTNSSWIEFSKLITSPAGAVTAQLSLWHGVNSSLQNVLGSKLWIDSLMFDAATTACGTLCNKSFEQGILYWTISGKSGSQTIETIGAYEGAKALKSEQLYTSGDTAAWAGITQFAEITESTNYRLKLWLKTENAINGHIKIKWRNAGGDLLNTQYPVYGINGTNMAWSSREATVTAPAGAKKAEISIWHGVQANTTNIQGSTIWLDSISLICLNLCNGGFEDGKVHWESNIKDGSEIETFEVQQGTKSIKTIQTLEPSEATQWTGISQQVLVTGGTDYNLDFWIKKLNTEQGHVKIKWRDANDQLISQEFPKTGINGSNATWALETMTVSSPANAETAEIFIWHGVSSNSNVNGSTLYIDNVTFVQAV